MHLFVCSICCNFEDTTVCDPVENKVTEIMEVENNAVSLI